MTACTQIEEGLLSAAGAGNLTAIVDIVARMTMSERAAVNPVVYDKVLFSIARSNETAEQAYATMMFIRHVGRYISPETVSVILKKPEQPAPQTLQQKTVDIQHFIAQNAALKRRSADIQIQQQTAV